MSWLSSGLKKLGHGLAPVVHVGAEVGGGALGLATGGPMGALAGWRVGDKLGNISQDALAGHDVRAHLGENLLGAGEAGVGGYLGGHLPGMLSHIPGADTVSGVLGMGGAGNGAVGSAIPDAAMGLPSSGASGGLGGLIGKLGGGKVDLQTILQGLSGAEGAYNTLQANKYRGQAIDLAKQQYAAGAPVRAEAQNRLLNTTTPDLSSTFQNAQNPFSPKYRSLQ